MVIETMSFPIENCDFPWLCKRVPEVTNVGMTHSLLWYGPFGLMMYLTRWWFSIVKSLGGTDVDSNFQVAICVMSFADPVLISTATIFGHLLGSIHLAQTFVTHWCWFEAARWVCGAMGFGNKHTWFVYTDWDRCPSTIRYVDFFWREICSVAGVWSTAMW